MRRLVIGMALALGACETAEDEPVMCAAPAGLYKVVMKAKSGTCGTGTESIQDMTPGAPSDCTGQKVPPGACSGEVNYTCSGMLVGEKTVSTVKGRATWEADGKKAAAELFIDIRWADGSPACSGIFDVTYTKI